MHCKNCALEVMSIKKKRKLPEDMDLDTFQKIVNELIVYGFDEFDLTPTVGEPFMHPNFIDMIEYLEKNDKVKRITFFTNLAVKDIDTSILWLMQNTVKTVMYISIYGTNRLDFDTFTNTSKCFANFSKNMTLLKSYYKISFRSLNFYIRNPKYNSSVKTLINLHITNLLKKKSEGEFFEKNNIQEYYLNGNWCGYMKINDNKRLDKKDGICKYVFTKNIVDATGDIYLCGPCDVMRTTYLGNIFYDSLNTTYNVKSWHKSIIEDQSKGIYTDCCKYCSEFHPCEAKIFMMYSKLHS